MCAMCGCGMAGNNGDIQSPDMPHSMPDMFNTDSLDTLGTSTDLPLVSAPQVEMN